jgi:hypothetical protein
MQHLEVSGAVRHIYTFYLGAGRLARSQKPEGPATGHLDTGFFLVFLGPRANAGMIPVIFFSKLPLYVSHVALH